MGTGSTPSDHGRGDSGAPAGGGAGGGGGLGLGGAGGPSDPANAAISRAVRMTELQCALNYQLGILNEWVEIYMYPIPSPLAQTLSLHVKRPRESEDPLGYPPVYHLRTHPLADG